MQSAPTAAEWVNILLVGEGNLTFSYALVRRIGRSALFSRAGTRHTQSHNQKQHGQLRDRAGNERSQLHLGEGQDVVAPSAMVTAAAAAAAAASPDALSAAAADTSYSPPSPLPAPAALPRCHVLATTLDGAAELPGKYPEAVPVLRYFTDKSRVRVTYAGGVNAAALAATLPPVAGSCCGSAVPRCTGEGEEKNSGDDAAAPASETAVVGGPSAPTLTPPPPTSAPEYHLVLFNNPHVGVEDLVRQRALLGHFFASVAACTGTGAPTPAPTDRGTGGGGVDDGACRSSSAACQRRRLGGHPPDSHLFTSSRAPRLSRAQVAVALCDEQPRRWRLLQLAAHHGYVCVAAVPVLPQTFPEYTNRRHQSDAAFPFERMVHYFFVPAAEGPAGLTEDQEDGSEGADTNKNESGKSRIAREVERVVAELAEVFSLFAALPSASVAAATGSGGGDNENTDKKSDKGQTRETQEAALPEWRSSVSRLFPHMQPCLSAERDAEKCDDIDVDDSNRNSSASSLPLPLPPPLRTTADDTAPPVVPLLHPLLAFHHHLHHPQQINDPTDTHQQHHHHQKEQQTHSPGGRCALGDPACFSPLLELSALPALYRRQYAAELQRVRGGSGGATDDATTDAAGGKEREGNATEAPVAPHEKPSETTLSGSTRSAATMGAAPPASIPPQLDAAVLGRPLTQREEVKLRRFLSNYGAATGKGKGRKCGSGGGSGGSGGGDRDRAAAAAAAANSNSSSPTPPAASAEHVCDLCAPPRSFLAAADLARHAAAAHREGGGRDAHQHTDTNNTTDSSGISRVTGDPPGAYCYACDCVYADEAALRRHVLFLDANDSAAVCRRWECDRCDRVFLDQRALAQHRRLAHPDVT